MQIPQVTAAEAKRFSKQWTFKGVVLLVDDSHCQFAADFANVVIRSFVQTFMQQQATAAKPKVVEG